MNLGQVFFKASEAMKNGQFHEARMDYESILNDSLESGVIHYNLGVSYYRTSDLGKAIYHFRKASELLPRDADTQFNLSFVRKQTIDKIEGTDHPIIATVDSHFPLNLRESSHFLMLTMVIFTIFSAICVFRHHEILKWIRTISLTCLLIAIFGFGFRYFNQENYGVITSVRANVYSGKSSKTVLLFSLHEGTEFQLIKNDGEWARIHLNDGKKGWIHSQHIIF